MHSPLRVSFGFENKWYHPSELHKYSLASIGRLSTARIATDANRVVLRGSRIPNFEIQYAIRLGKFKGVFGMLLNDQDLYRSGYRYEGNLKATGDLNERPFGQKL